MSPLRPPQSTLKSRSTCKEHGEQSQSKSYTWATHMVVQVPIQVQIFCELVPCFCPCSITAPLLLIKEIYKKMCQIFYFKDCKIIEIVKISKRLCKIVRNAPPSLL